MTIQSGNTHRYLAWGRAHRYRHFVHCPWDVAECRRAVTQAGPVLPYGRGRSYGDSCLNDGHTLIDTTALDRFLSLSIEDGVLVCESGVTLATILQVLRSRADHGQHWFLPVSPGTKFVTVGGAIANDVHGKNHHRMGTFGRHVLWFDLACSDGSIVRCSPQENQILYRATIGGLGLTGLITTAAIQLMRVPHMDLEIEEHPTENIDEFYDLVRAGAGSWDYSAAWIDCLSSGSKLGRGILTRARHADIERGLTRAQGSPRLRVGFDAPGWLMNPMSIAAFNNVFYRRIRRAARGVVGYEKVFYPLDSIAEWNRLYGSRGFFQYQCVVPPDSAREAVGEMLKVIARERQGSFLAVLKTFGGLSSPGMLSFPMEGTTLALDFPNLGRRTLSLLESLDVITREARGRVYPAKDGRMSGEAFRQYFPQVSEFAKSVDPNFSSTFWRRVYDGSRLEARAGQ